MATKWGGQFAAGQFATGQFARHQFAENEEGDPTVNTIYSTVGANTVPYYVSGVDDIFYKAEDD